MQVSKQTNERMHSILPIDNDENILAVYKHHWFAYVSLWVTAVLLVIVIMGVAIFLVQASSDQADLSRFRAAILGGASIISGLVALFTLIPAWLKSQEHLVLTEEALLQTLQPSLFAAKTSQLNLQHINDVTVKRDFFGTMFGYGHITIETPGEQDNYEFSIVPNPEGAAREIVAAHENYNAALQGGRLSSTLGTPEQTQTPQIDPQQYEQFLQYQQMMAKQQQDKVPSAQTGQTETAAPTAAEESKS